MLVAQYAAGGASARSISTLSRHLYTQPPLPNYRPRHGVVYSLIVYHSPSKTKLFLTLNVVAVEVTELTVAIFNNKPP